MNQRLMQALIITQYTAVNELGMVYPSRSQVIGYDSKESEYVKQYKDISK